MDLLVLGKQLLVALLLINAIFWGLFPHSAHCKVAANFGIKQCPPHWIHVYVMGLLSFVMALYVQQGSAGLH
jgi:hypothetical protein